MKTNTAFNKLFRNALRFWLIGFHLFLSIPSLAATEPVQRMRDIMDRRVGEPLAQKEITNYNGGDVELITFKAKKSNCSIFRCANDNCVVIVSQLMIRKNRAVVPRPVKTWCANEVLLTNDDLRDQQIPIGQDDECAYDHVIY